MAVTKKRKTWKDYLESVLVAIFLALFVRTFVISGYRIPTSSMAPTLLPGDFIFSYKLPFGIKVPLTSQKIGASQPERGDVVVFTYPDRPRVNYVKRVIGLPGDRVELKDHALYLNGQEVPHVSAPATKAIAEIGDLFQVKKESINGRSHQILLGKNTNNTSFGPLVVPPGEIFVLGDNRDASDDSRYWGTVPYDRIEGRVILIWLSLSWQRRGVSEKWPQVRWERMFQGL